jgi:two-component system, NarL family, nitrate/nitrite response regulator NarL
MHSGGTEMNEFQTRTRIVIADSHPVFRAELRSVLQSNNFAVVGQAWNGADAMALVRRTVPDILLLDIALPSVSGFEVLRKICQLDKDIRVILITAAITKREIVHALQLGARGVLWKSSGAALLLKSIHCVMDGELWVSREIVGDLVEALQKISFIHAAKLQARKTIPAKQLEERISFGGCGGTKCGLTLREIEIVNATVSGESNHDIAAKFGISKHTVKHHLSRIYEKVGVYSRLELAVFATHHDLSGPIQHLRRGA